MKKSLFLLLACVLVLSACPCFAVVDPGEQAVRDLWAAIKARDMPKLDKMLSPEFQSIHQDGARNKAQELKLLKNLNMGDYKLSDFQTTSQGPVMVVTYKVSVTQTIDGKRLDKKPAYRMSVFMKAGNGWQWLAHANLRPLR